MLNFTVRDCGLVLVTVMLSTLLGTVMAGGSYGCGATEYTGARSGLGNRYTCYST